MLIVDDEPSILSSTAALLRDLDFDVATCADAQHIVEAVERVRPDVLLQDVRMPGLDLERLVVALREDERFRELRIVVFTASMEVDEIRDRLQVEAALEKPFRPRQLLAAIHGALDVAADS